MIALNSLYSFKVGKITTFAIVDDFGNLITNKITRTYFFINSRSAYQINW